MNPDLNPIVQSLNRLIAAQQKGPWDYASTVAVVLTLLVLIWYTYETYQLRRTAQEQTTKMAGLLREAHRQNEVLVMPILAILVASPEELYSSEVVYGSANPKLVLRNVGTGPAFNVSIDKYAVEGRELQFEHGSHMLTPGEKRTLSFHLQEQHSGTMGDLDTMYDWINNGLLPDLLNITARCRSATSVDYSFTFSFTPRDGRLNVVFEGMKSTAAA